MESLTFNTSNAIGASTVIAALYLVFRFLLKPKSPLDKLPALGKPSDPYLQELLIEGSRKVRDQFERLSIERLLTPFSVPRHTIHDP